MTARSCLICDVAETEVATVRQREGYTLGCGTETNTEAGFDYTELSPRHRWADWRDGELAGRGIEPSEFERFRRARFSSPPIT